MTLKPSARILRVPTDVDAFQAWREPAKRVVVSFLSNLNGTKNAYPS